MLFHSTPQGLGLNDDSIAYIAGARSLIAGDGYREIWIVSAGPVTHFPPGFPSALAALGLMTGLDPLRGARLLNGLLFGLNTFLVGWLALRMTGSRLAGWLTALLFLLTPSLLRVHSNAMSEPLFIFFTLLAFLLLDLYFKNIRSERPFGWLIAAGSVIGLAYLTRYAALALLATGIAMLVIFHSDWRTRLARSAVLGLSMLPWMAAWALRNTLVGGALTNRQLGWHPINADNIHTGIRTFAGLILPVDAWQLALLKIDGLIEIISLLLAAGLLWWLIAELLRRFRNATGAEAEPISLLNGLYVVAYFLALVATMTFFDPATRFQLRILAPVFVSLILLLAYALTKLAARERGRFAAAALAAAVLVASTMGQVETVSDLRRGGQVYANERWFDAKVLPVLRELPADVAIHTNQPGVVYLHVGRPAWLLPEDEAGIQALQQQVLAGEAVIVLFKSSLTDEAMQAYYDQLGAGLYAQRYDGDIIYTAPP